MAAGRVDTVSFMDRTHWAAFALIADPSNSLDVYRTISILGYCLLPIVALAAVAVFVDLRGAVGACSPCGCSARSEPPRYRYTQCATQPTRDSRCV